MPKRANTPPKADFCQCFQYHYNLVHSTEECIILTDKREDFIKLGRLKDFIHKPQSYRLHNSYRQDQDKGKDRDCSHQSQTKNERSWSRSRERKERSLNQPRCVINTIVGGFVWGRCSQPASALDRARSIKRLEPSIKLSGNLFYLVKLWFSK